MNRLLLFLFLMLPIAVRAASPGYEGFRGVAPVVVTTNKTTGLVTVSITLNANQFTAGSLKSGLPLTNLFLWGDSVIPTLTPNSVLYLDSGQRIAVSATTDTELGYLSGVTSAIQTQLSNDVRVAAGTGATVTPVGSAGRMTYTVTPDVSTTLLLAASNAIVTYANGVTNSSIVRQTQLTTASNAIVALIGSSGGNFSTNASDGSATFFGTGVGSIAIKDNAQTEYFQLEAPFNIQSNNVTRGFSNALPGVTVAQPVDTGTNQWQNIPLTPGQYVTYNGTSYVGSNLPAASGGSTQLLALAVGALTGTNAGFGGAFPDAPGGIGIISHGGIMLSNPVLPHYVSLNTNGQYVFNATNNAGASNTFLKVTNSTPATSGVQQSPPDIIMAGNAWNTVGTTSQPVSIRMRSTWSQANPPTGTVQWDFNTSSGAYVNMFNVVSGGTLTSVQGGSLGANVSLAGGTSFFKFGGSSSSMRSVTNGIIELFDSTATTFTGVSFGSNHFAFPRLNRLASGFEIIGAGGVGTSSNNLYVAGVSHFTNGFASYASNVLAPTSITFPSSTATWTNTFGINIEVYIDNTGVTATAIKKNGTQIYTTGNANFGLHPLEYFSETYSVGTPVASWSPQ